jgi:hypothetical protein
MERRMVNFNIKNMLLTLLLNLGMAAGTVATPPTGVGGGRVGIYNDTEQQYKKIQKGIEIEDSEIIAIVQICLKLTII